MTTWSIIPLIFLYYYCKRKKKTLSLSKVFYISEWSLNPTECVSPSPTIKLWTLISALFMTTHDSFMLPPSRQQKIVHPGSYRLACSEQRSRLCRCGDWRQSLGGAVGWSLLLSPSSRSHVTAKAGQVSSKDITLPLSPLAGAEVLLISRRSC